MFACSSCFSIFEYHMIHNSGVQMLHNESIMQGSTRPCETLYLDLFFCIIGFHDERDPQSLWREFFATMKLVLDCSEFRNVESFINDHLKNYKNVKLVKIWGSPPKIVLRSGKQQEITRIDGWKTENIIEFLDSRLESWIENLDGWLHFTVWVLMKYLLSWDRAHVSIKLLMSALWTRQCISERAIICATTHFYRHIIDKLAKRCASKQIMVF